MNRHGVVAAIVVVVCGLHVGLLQAGVVSFRGLGDLPGGVFDSLATGVSADGRVVIGRSFGNNYQAFRWTSEEGMQALGVLPGSFSSTHAYAISTDGSVIVGSGTSINGTEAFRWTETSGLVGMGDQPGNAFYSQAFAISADGEVIVGASSPLGAPVEAFRWTPAEGMIGLGDLPGGTVEVSRAYGVSADGMVVVGQGRTESGDEAFRWAADTGMVGLGDLSDGTADSQATGASADGSVVVGYGANASGSEAFRWTAEGGMDGIGYLPGSGAGDSNEFSIAHAVSADGSVVVGVSTSAEGTKAFYWTLSGGMRSVEDLLRDAGVDLTGWSLQTATAITPDGHTLVGTAVNPNGDFEAYRVTIPEPSTSLVVLSGIVYGCFRR